MSVLANSLPPSSIPSTPIDINIPETTMNTHTSYSSITHAASHGDLHKVGNHSNSPVPLSMYRKSLFSNSKPSLFTQTREKERFELSTLNDKFADYVEKVRYLEAQNKKIQMDTNLLTEKQHENCQRIKTTFEKEIVQLKEIAEKLFKDKNIIFN